MFDWKNRSLERFFLSPASEYILPLGSALDQANTVKLFGETEDALLYSLYGFSRWATLPCRSNMAFSLIYYLP